MPAVMLTKFNGIEESCPAKQDKTVPAAKYVTSVPTEQNGIPGKDADVT